MIPSNAQAIIAARAKGMKPAELIIVSLIGRVNEENHTIYVNPNKRYEWQWARGLEMCLFAEQGISWSQTAKDILAANPRKLYLWDANRREGTEIWMHPHPADIQKPKETWRHVLAYVEWVGLQNREFAQCS